MVKYVGVTDKYGCESFVKLKDAQEGGYAGYFAFRALVDQERDATPFCVEVTTGEAEKIEEMMKRGMYMEAKILILLLPKDEIPKGTLPLPHSRLSALKGLTGSKTKDNMKR